jgi:hypothetical protein
MPASNPRLRSGDEDDGNSYIETRANGLAFQMTGVCRGKDNTMSKSLIDSVRHEEETLGDELPDMVLEVAGSKGWEQAGNSFTLAFCMPLHARVSVLQHIAEDELRFASEATLRAPFSSEQAPEFFSASVR